MVIEKNYFSNDSNFFHTGWMELILILFEKDAYLFQKDKRLFSNS